MLLVAFGLILLLACSRGNLLVANAENESANENGLAISLFAADISENTALSTKQDELMLFVHGCSDQSTEALLSTYFKMQNFEEREVAISCPNDSIVVCLVEMDTDKNLTQVEAVIRIHYDRILKAYLEGDFSAIHELLGDDDLLGIKKLKCEPESWEFKGIHLFDKYRYQLSISAR